MLSFPIKANLKKAASDGVGHHMFTIVKEGLPVTNVIVYVEGDSYEQVRDKLNDFLVGADDPTTMISHLGVLRASYDVFAFAVGLAIGLSILVGTLYLT